MIICTCYSSLNLTHSKAHLHTLGAPLPFTQHVCLPLEKADFTFQFTAASSADVWPAKLQYQQWSFGSNCFGRKKAVRSSSLERLVSFLGRKYLFTFSPHSEHGVLSLRAQPRSSLGCPRAGIQRLSGPPAPGLLGQGQLYVPPRCGFAQLSSEMDTVLPSLIKQPSSPGQHKQVRVMDFEASELQNTISSPV